jgi:hypothetical protein
MISAKETYTFVFLERNGISFMRIVYINSMHLTKGQTLFYFLSNAHNLIVLLKFYQQRKR